jgi:hypothetical protein
MYWSGLVSDQFFFNHSLFYPFAGADDSGAVTLQGRGSLGNGGKGAQGDDLTIRISRRRSCGSDVE